jgi:integrase/recombinase XerD
MKHELLSFIQHLSAQRRSRNTISAYWTDLNLLTEFLLCPGSAVNGWGDVTVDMLAAYKDYLIMEGFASSTIARKISAIRTFFTYLETVGIRNDNPSESIQAPQADQTSPPLLDPETMDLLRAAPEPATTPKAIRDRAMLELLCTTGLKVSELARLEVDDVDIERAVLTIGARSPSVREVNLSEESLDCVTRYLEEGRTHLVKTPSEQALFLNHLGLALTRQGIWLILKEYVRHAALPDIVTPSALRRTLLNLNQESNL